MSTLAKLPALISLVGVSVSGLVYTTDIYSSPLVHLLVFSYLTNTACCFNILLVIISLQICLLVHH